MPSYEVIVVGLGAVGGAATWHLARLGTKVLGIDPYKPPHEFGSSAGETRLTRAAVGEGVEYSPLALLFAAACKKTQHNLQMLLSGNNAALRKT